MALESPGRAKSRQLTLSISRPIRSAFLVLVAGFLAISSCAPRGLDPPPPTNHLPAQRALLNSERIRQKFGSYGIDVLSESKQLRVSSLYSLESGKKIMRTLAVVIYPRSIPKPLMAEHAEIKSGHSIGQVFKNHGWSIRKQNIYLGEMAASHDYAAVYSAMGGIREVGLAVHIYQLSVGKNGTWFHYARIAEVHHPDYLSLGELRKLYQPATIEPANSSQDIQNTLHTVAGVMKGLTLRN